MLIFCAVGLQIRLSEKLTSNRHKKIVLCLFFSKIDAKFVDFSEILF